MNELDDIEKKLEKRKEQDKGDIEQKIESRYLKGGFKEMNEYIKSSIKKIISDYPHEVSVKNLSEIPKDINVKNFPEPVKEMSVNNFPEPVKEVTVKNPVTEIEIKNPVREVDVKNMPSISFDGIKTSIKGVTNVLESIPEAIAKAVKRIVQPVTVTNKVEVVLIDPKTDRPYKASTGSFVPTIGGGGATTLKTPNGDSAMDDTTDSVNVTIVGGSSSGTQYTEGDTDASITGNALMMEDAANTLIAATGDTTNGLDVDVTRSALPSGASTSAKQDTAQTALDAIKTAVETLDNIVSGSEAQVDIVGALPAGTNAIGKLAANSGVDIGDVDVTSVSGTVTTKGIPSDIDINGSNTNHADKYYTNAGAVTDGIVWSPAAGKRWHVLTLYINVSAAATVTIEDDLAGGDVARWKGEFAANSGVVLTYSKEHPFSSAEDAADLIITTSAGNIYVQAVGYEI